MTRTSIALLSTVTMLAALSLAFGAPYLGTRLPGGLPLGNLLAALGLCSAAGIAVRISDPGTRLRLFSMASLWAAVAWLPVSVGLAGNLSLNFSGWRGSAWLVLSLGIGVAVFSSLAWSVGRALLAVGRRRPTP